MCSVRDVNEAAKLLDALNIKEKEKLRARAYVPAKRRLERQEAKPVERHVDKPLERQEGKPLERQEAKPLERQADKPVERHGDKPQERQEDKPLEFLCPAAPAKKASVRTRDQAVQTDDEFLAAEEDAQYLKCADEWLDRSSTSCVNIREVHCADLVALRCSLVVDVSRDMRLKWSEAREFRLRFGRVRELTRQRVPVGQVAVLEDRERFLYYLVTKDRFSDRTITYNLWQCLLQLRAACERSGVRRMAMARLCCSAVDRLDWHRVRIMLSHVFRDTNVLVTVCIPPC